MAPKTGWVREFAGRLLPGVNMFRNLLFAWGAIALAFAPVAAEAASVSPMIVEVDPMGRGSVARIELNNPDDGAFPVEVQMFRGDISEAGELNLTPADAEFLVFPPQMVVPAKSQQIFRVQYIGEPELAASQIYYMQIRQIPVDFAAGDSQVQLVVNFNVLVNVVPDGARSEPVVQSVTPVTREGVHGIEVQLGNSGNRYFTAASYRWEISGRGVDGTEVGFSRNQMEMAKLIGVGVVAPGKTRVFFIPTETPLVEGSIQAALAP